MRERHKPHRLVVGGPFSDAKGSNGSRAGGVGASAGGVENEKPAERSSLMIFHLGSWFDQERRKNKARKTAAKEVRHRRRVRSLGLNL
jgi:hypothetical protein